MEEKGDNIETGAKKIDEAWKEAVAKEAAAKEGKDRKLPEVTFNMFITGLMMEAFVALGELENPVSNKKETNLTHAKFIIDTLSLLKEKTQGNLSQDESALIEGVLYELRMKYVSKVNAKG
jgi:hypothetical protein